LRDDVRDAVGRSDDADALSVRGRLDGDGRRSQRERLVEPALYRWRRLYYILEGGCECCRVDATNPDVHRSHL
jgi:hypothetical protein